MKTIIFEASGTDLKGIGAGSTGQSAGFGIKKNDIFKVSRRERICIRPLAELLNRPHWPDLPGAMDIVFGVVHLAIENLVSVQVEELAFNDGFDRVLGATRCLGCPIFPKFNAQGFELLGECLPINHFRSGP